MTTNFQVRNLPIQDPITGTESLVVLPTSGGAKRILVSALALRTELEAIRQLPSGAQQGEILIWTDGAPIWIRAPWVDEAAAEGIARSIVDGTYILEKLTEAVPGVTSSVLRQIPIAITESGGTLSFLHVDGSRTNIILPTGSGGGGGLNSGQVNALIESAFANALRNNTETGISVSWQASDNTVDFVVTPPTGAQIVTALAALSGSARLSYNSLKDLPTLVSDGDRAKLRRLQISVITNLEFDTSTNTLTLNYEDADGTADDTSVVIQAGSGGGGLSTVSSDTTLTGTGTSSDPLQVANPFTNADETKLDALDIRSITSLTISSGSLILTYVDGAGDNQTRTIALPPSGGGGLSVAQVQDAVGAMFSGNTETLVSVTYDAMTRKINVVADNQMFVLSDHQEAVFDAFDSNTWENVTDRAVMSIGLTFNSSPINASIRSALQSTWGTTFTEGTERTNVYLAARIPLDKKAQVSRYRVSVASTDYPLAEARHVVDGADLDNVMWAFYEVLVTSTSANNIVQAQRFDLLEIDVDRVNMSGAMDSAFGGSETIQDTLDAAEEKVVLEVKDNSITPDKAKFDAGTKTGGNTVVLNTAGDGFSSKADAGLDIAGVQDTAGAMVDGNVETGISLTYDSTKKKIDAALELTEHQQEVFNAFTSEGWVQSTDNKQMGIVGPVASEYNASIRTSLASWQTEHRQGVHLAGTRYFAIRIPLADMARANRYRITEPTDDAVPTVELTNATLAKLITQGADIDGSGDYAYYQVTWPEVPAGARVVPQIFDPFELDDAKVKVTVQTDATLTGDGSLDDPLSVVAGSGGGGGGTSTHSHEFDTETMVASIAQFTDVLDRTVTTGLTNRVLNTPSEVQVGLSNATNANLHLTVASNNMTFAETGTYDVEIGLTLQSQAVNIMTGVAAGIGAGGARQWLDVYLKRKRGAAVAAEIDGTRQTVLLRQAFNTNGNFVGPNDYNAHIFERIAIVAGDVITLHVAGVIGQSTENSLTANTLAVAQARTQAPSQVTVTAVNDATITVGGGGTGAVVPSGNSFPANPTVGDRFNLLVNVTQTGFEIVTPVTANLSGVTAARANLSDTSTLISYPSGATHAPYRNRTAYVKVPNRPDPTMVIVNGTSYPVTSAGLPNTFILTGSTATTLVVGTPATVNVTYTGGQVLHPDIQFDPSEYEYAGIMGWIHAPTSWTESELIALIQRTRDVQVVAGIDVLHRGPGIGLSIASANSDATGQLQLVSPTFDLDDADKQHGELILEARFNMTNRSSNLISFDEGSTSQDTAITMTRVADLTFASDVRNSTTFLFSQPGNGVVTGSADVFKSGNKLGDITLYLAKNASNQLGFYLHWDGDAGSDSFALNLELDIVFSPTDVPSGTAAPVVLWDVTNTGTLPQYGFITLPSISRALTAADDNRTVRFEIAATSTNAVPDTAQGQYAAPGIAEINAGVLRNTWQSEFSPFLNQLDIALPIACTITASTAWLGYFLISYRRQGSSPNYTFDYTTNAIFGRPGSGQAVTAYLWRFKATLV